LSEDGERETFGEGNISGNNVIAPRAEILRAEGMGKQLYLYVWGIVQYHDGFTSGRWTRYCHRYNFSALDQGKYSIPRQNYRYHHKGNQTDDNG
jgi:hypothetical protein